MFRFITLAIVSFSSAAALAFPVNQLRALDSTTQSAIEILEAKLGRSASATERSQIADFVREQSSSKAIEVSNRSPRKKLKCWGFTAGAGAVIARAVCLHVHLFNGYGFEPTIQAYGLAMLGVGMSGALVGQVIGLDVIYDPSRYDKDFDPVPGNYGVISIGLTGGIGFTSFGGDSGNKRIDGLSFNVGAGFDFPTISMLVIE